MACSRSTSSSCNTPTMMHAVPKRILAPNFAYYSRNGADSKRWHHVSAHARSLSDDRGDAYRRSDSTHRGVMCDSGDGQASGFFMPTNARPRRVDILPRNLSPMSNVSSSASPGSLYRSVCEDLCWHVQKGYLLILLNLNFNNTFIPRHGADSDITEAKKFFRNAGFHIEEVFTDKTKEEMDSILYERSQDTKLSGYDCLVVIVSSHGNEDGVLGVDNKPLPVQDIVDRFKPGKCSLGVNVPRIFMVQACRGQLLDRGVCYVPSPVRDGVQPIDDDFQCTLGLKKLPTDANTIIAYATTQGKKAHSYAYPWSGQEGQSGSWFMKCAMQVFAEYADREDLLTMLTRVNRGMVAYGDDDNVKQISSQVSQLTCKVYFTLQGSGVGS